MEILTDLRERSLQMLEARRVACRHLFARQARLRSTIPIVNPIARPSEAQGKAKSMQVQDVMEEKRPVERPIDGRRQRTVDSRARIVSAMLELTHAGHVTVSAELVAERASVGLRTVFRHFNDMDSLYREMSLAIEARLREEVGAFAFTSTDWREQLAELI